MDKFFSDNKRAFLFVVEEFFLVLLIILQAFFLLGLDLSSKSFSFFSRPILPQNVLWFVSTILFFVTLYFGISVRDKKVVAVHKEFSKLLLGTAKQKVFGVSKEFLALFFFEFVFAIIIAISIYLYLDPDKNVVPWPFNFIVFFAILAFGLFLFSKTKFFREATYGPSVVSRKILPAERLFHVSRSTNKRTGTIRFRGKKSFRKK